ncbi:MAG: tetratricopeptide repeat protein [Candidatus Omnitrophica bacterium]|nr:tetratricopeptide repeat protein [Candidatus Omnitrophota bacterium]
MKKTIIPVVLILAAVVFTSYFNSLNSPFIWDDEALIIKNPLIRTGTPTPKILTSDLYNGISAGSNFYRPAQTFSYWMNFRLCGLEPFGYHLTNILLHAIVSILVFIFIFILVKDWLLAFAASLFFAANPLSTEAVTYVSGRAEMLLGLFLISSLILFIKSLETKSKWQFALSLVLFISGLLSKELAMVFPFVVLAYIYYFRREEARSRNFLVKNCLPFFAILGVYLVLRLTILSFSTLRPPALSAVPFYLRISVLPKVFLTYFKLLVMPVGLHMSRTLLRPVSPVGFFIAWFALGTLVVLCFKALCDKNRRGVLPFMFFWFLIFLLPQSGLFAINAFVSEHFIYLSGVSFFLGLAYLLKKYLRPVLFAVSVAAITAFYSGLTISRNYDWQSPLIFYKKIIISSPDSFQAHNNLGLQYEFRSELDKALTEYRKAIAIKPDLLEAHANRANLYFKMGRLAQAKEEYAIVEKLSPPGKAGEIQNNIGCVYEVEGKLDEALKRYVLALKLDPTLSFAHFNIARLNFARGDLIGASEEILKSLPEIQPNNDNERVIKNYLSSVKVISDGAVFYNDLGVRFAGAGDFADAAKAFLKSLELKPLYADAHFNLGLAYWNMGQNRKAVFEFKNCLKADPGHEKAKQFLVEIIYKK